jgi:hypothetical protein
MHIYFMTRGVKHARDIFISQMQSQFFPWKKKNLKTGKEEITAVQGALRPIELWEYVIPEESYEDAMALLGFDPKKKANNIIDKAKLKIIQKALGAKEFPKLNPKAGIVQRFIIRKGVSAHPIGIRRDKRGKGWGYEQEML